MEHRERLQWVNEVRKINQRLQEASGRSGALEFGG